LERTYYSESCKTDFFGFPDIPGWHFSLSKIDESITGTKQIYFFDENKGVLITDKHIFLTENDGETWKKTFSSSFFITYDICFIDSMHGFIAARLDGKTCILKTINGGHHWSTLFTDTKDLIRQFSFVDTLLGFAFLHYIDMDFSLSRYYIGKTTDGGFSWNEISGLSAVHANAQDIFMSPNGFGYITGDHDEIHLTNDFGESWTTIQTGFNVNAIQFLDLNTGFVGDFHSLNKTVDGGMTWTKISDFSPAWIQFFSKSEGLTLQTVGYEVDFDLLIDCNAFFSTSDGGTTWDEGPTSISFYMDNVNFVNSNLGYGLTYIDGYEIVKMVR
jgi:photosystem II stability/assembly factor-like uncharacterized protein